MTHKVRLFVEKDIQSIKVVGTEKYSVEESVSGGPLKQIDVVADKPFKVEVEAIDKTKSPIAFTSRRQRQST